MGKTRYGGVTIYGAIGNCLSNAVFTFGKSTNKVEFIDFMEEVRQNISSSEIKPYVIIDNHAAHRSNEVVR